jgi:hypothetical protein
VGDISQVAMALTGGPSFLVLDEPSAGMDAQARFFHCFTASSCCVALFCSIIRLFLHCFTASSYCFTLFYSILILLYSINIMFYSTIIRLYSIIVLFKAPSCKTVLQCHRSVSLLGGQKCAGELGIV